MCATSASLTAFKITVRSGRTAFPGCELIGIHAKAHRTAALPPFETSFSEDPVQPFRFGLVLYLP